VVVSLPRPLFSRPHTKEKKAVGQRDYTTVA